MPNSIGAVPPFSGGPLTNRKIAVYGALAIQNRKVNLKQADMHDPDLDPFPLRSLHSRRPERTCRP